MQQINKKHGWSLAPLQCLNAALQLNARDGGGKCKCLCSSFTLHQSSQEREGENSNSATHFLHNYLRNVSSSFRCIAKHVFFHTVLASIHTPISKSPSLLQCYKITVPKKPINARALSFMCVRWKKKIPCLSSLLQFFYSSVLSRSSSSTSDRSMSSSSGSWPSLPSQGSLLEILGMAAPLTGLVLPLP